VELLLSRESAREKESKEVKFRLIRSIHGQPDAANLVAILAINHFGQIYILQLRT
jgi:hypothetical protein